MIPAAEIDVGTTDRPPANKRRRRTLALLLLACLAAVALYRGLADEAGRASFVAAVVRRDLAAELQADAGRAYIDGSTTRVPESDGGRTFYVVDFNLPPGGELAPDVERWTLLDLNSDDRLPPFRLDGFRVYQLAWFRVIGSVTVIFPGFLGRTQSVFVSVSVVPPRFTTLTGSHLAPANAEPADALRGRHPGG